jgi:hypothetical protein
MAVGAGSDEPLAVTESMYRFLIGCLRTTVQTSAAAPYRPATRQGHRKATAVAIRRPQACLDALRDASGALARHRLKFG